MAAGDKILAKLRNDTMVSIDNARAKWGLNKKNSLVSEGTIATASDFNNLIDWLTEAKNKSGATTSIESDVNVGNLMYETKLNNLQSQANSILNWCVCHGNCKGSCTGGCTGSCSSSCGRNCGENCGCGFPSDGCSGH